MITLAIISAVTVWWKRRGRRPERLTKAQSRARIRSLRSRGYTVRTVRLTDGTRVVLRSRRPSRG